MNRLTILLLMISLTAWSATPVKRNLLSGRVIDKTDQSAVMQATVQLLSAKDSTMLSGNVTDDKGLFKLTSAKGKYLLKVSYVGYIPFYKEIFISNDKSEFNLGVIQLESDAIMLKEAVIVAEAPEVTALGDTLVYNSSAYRLPQGAALEALVKKLPGAEVDEDGKITINGKEIKKIMVNGKEFFADKPELALKNLPSTVIDKVLAYDKKSDMARLTGIDDGEEETVLDLTLKPGMNKGWFGNADVAAGTEKRYDGKFMVNRFIEKNQLTLMGSTNNVNDESFPGGGGGFKHRLPDGLNAIKRAGFNFAQERKRLQMGGSVSYEYKDADVQSRSNSETFISSDVSSFKNAAEANRNKFNNFLADFQLEWKPNDKTILIFRPRISINDSHDHSLVNAFTFNEESSYSINELIDAYDSNNLFNLIPKENVVNRIFRNSYIKKNNLNTNGTLTLNHKIDKKGRNITVRLKASYSDVDNEQFRISETEYFQKSNNDRLNILNRYVTSPTSTGNYAIRTGYIEPIFKGGFLQFNYELNYKVSKTDNSTYNMPNDWNIGEGFNKENGELNKELSKHAKYQYFNHNTELSFRWQNAKNRLNVGVSVQPQKSRFSYMKGDYAVDTVRNIVNLTPTFDYRWMINKTSSLQLNYRGFSGQPNMLNLLPIVDNTNPLNVKVGNPGLKPSFTNRLGLHFNLFNTKKQRGIMSYVRYQRTQNAISNRSVYNEETGGYTTQPENINGNWNIFGMLGLNTALKNKRYTLNNYSTSGFQNMVKYMGRGEIIEGKSDKNITKRLVLSDRIRGTYRNDWFECSLTSSIRYTNSKNSFQEENDMNTYDYSFGGSTNIHLPWNMSISTNISQSSRRGYTEANMNTNELIWNAQISQSFLKKNAATVSIQLFDILANQSNISRSISASMRQDSEFNSIFSYCMVHFVYRFDKFGGKHGAVRRGPYSSWGGGGYGHSHHLGHH